MMNKLEGGGFASPITILALLMFLFLPAISSAQVAPRFDIFGGYSYLRFDGPSIALSDRPNLNGWDIDAAGSITKKFGVAINASGHYGSQLTVYTYMIGPQYTWRREKSKFYVHGLFGKAQNKVDMAQAGLSNSKSVGRAFAVGGGFDYDLRPRWSIRVFQAEYLNSSTFAATQHDVRVSTGIVFHFGHMGRAPRL